MLRQRAFGLAGCSRLHLASEIPGFVLLCCYLSWTGIRSCDLLQTVVLAVRAPWEPVRRWCASVATL